MGLQVEIFLFAILFAEHRMGKLPDSWKASISEPQKTGAYVEVTIEGPGTFAWTCRFTGPDEQEAGFVRTTIRNGLLPFLIKK
jgi:hypothetical protein